MVARSIRQLCCRAGLSTALFVALATGVTLLALATTDETSPVAFRAVSALGMGCVMVAVFAAFLTGTVLRLLIAVAALTILGLNLATFPDAAETVLIVVSGIVSFGFAIDAVLTGLSTIAAAEDEIATAKVRQRAESEGKEFERREAFRISRALHDRAANTLHAAALARENSPELRERCGHDLALMQTGMTITSAGKSLAELAETAAAHARRLGLRLELDQAGDRRLTPATFEHLDSIVTESLTNIAKYANAKTATLRIHEHRIVIGDDGSGWRTDTLGSPGNSHGTRNAQADGIRQAGITVAYSNQLTGGLTVTIAFGDAVVQKTEPFHAGFTMTELATVPMARGIAFWMLGLCLMVMVVTWQQLPAWWWVILAGIGTGCVMTLINWSARRELPAIATAAASLSIVAVLSFAPSQSNWVWLSCLPAGLILIVTAWLSPARTAWWPLAGYTAGIAILLTELPATRESIAIACVTWLFGACATAGFRLLNRRVGEYDALINQALTELAELRTREATEASRARARDLILQRCLAEVGPVFTAISAPGGDPSEPALNRRIRSCERLLRNAIALGADLSPLSGELLRLLWHCHVAGVEFEVNASSAVASPDQVQAGQLREYLESVIATVEVAKLVVTSYLIGPAGGLIVAATLVHDHTDDGWLPAAPDQIVATFDPPDLLIVEREWHEGVPHE